MLRLYIIRHGQSTNNAEPNFAKHEFEPPLTPKGIEESVALANHNTLTVSNFESFVCDD